ncbi:hypothetical protein Bca52824_037177 [Brassica carinata]|uniref:Uncharacterized protein n=1 Tax=Brassica carinata TaxID=52824 RepID=A0A8X7V274_BRACI|nr:hypothetical protein Bca52824_037177 [Brassica carinata]
MVTKEQVEASLTSKLKPIHLEVNDISGGCGSSFEVEVVSEQFEGKRLLERHRMVNAKAQTPQQWKPSQDSATQAKDA